MKSMMKNVLQVNPISIRPFKTTILALGLCFSFVGISFAQSDKATAKNADDRFAYSYGILLGDNLQKVGLTADVVSIDKLSAGALSFADGKETLTEADAQKAVNSKLSEITANHTAKAEGKEVKVYTKAGLAEFSYQYGVLIGANWKNFGINHKQIAIKEFEKGIFEMLSGKETAITAQAAQAEVSAKYQALQQDKLNKKVAENEAFLEENKKKPNVMSLASGIQYEVLEKGSGKQATASSTVTTHYHGTLLDGTIFDSSVNRGEPISFNLSGVIKGWQEVIPMMKEGGKWRVFIPAHLAYGARTRGSIPGNSLLIFEIELLGVE